MRRHPLGQVGRIGGPPLDLVAGGRRREELGQRRDETVDVGTGRAVVGDAPAGTHVGADPAHQVAHPAVECIAVGIQDLPPERVEAQRGAVVDLVVVQRHGLPQRHAARAPTVQRVPAPDRDRHADRLAAPALLDLVDDRWFGRVRQRAHPGVGPEVPAHREERQRFARTVLRRPGDDERCPGLVHEHQVGLVDERHRARPPHHVAPRDDHVVPQQVVAELGVAAVRDVGRVGSGASRAFEAGGDHTDPETEEPQDRAHLLGVGSGEVVCRGHHVHALARQRVEVGGQGDRQRASRTDDGHRQHPCLHRRARHQLRVVDVTAQ